MGSDPSRQMRFQGKARIGSLDNVPVVAELAFDKFDSTSLNVSIDVLEIDNKTISPYSLPDFDDIEIFDSRYNGVTLHITEIYGHTRTGNHIELNANLIQINLSEQVKDTPAKYLMHVEFVPTGIFNVVSMVECDGKGNIKVKRPYMEDVEVFTDYGSITIGESCDHFDKEYFDSKAMVSIQRATCSGLLDVKEPHSLNTAHDNVLKLLDDVAVLLSLCCRVPVTYYEVCYHQLEPRQESAWSESLFRRKLWNPPKRSKTEALINVRNLSGNGLELLLKALRSSQFNTVIKSAIQFLSSSYRSTSIETSFFLCFSALDALTTTVYEATGSRTLLTDAPWRKIETAVKDVIDTILNGPEMHVVAEIMKSKIPELKRASTGTRITSVCADLGVKTDDLWLKTSFQDGIRSANDLRNELFHGAACSDFGEMIRSTVRLRILTERLIIKLVQWPEDRLFLWHEQPLHMLRER